MAIHKPSDLALEKKNFAMLISGSPGLGKTTLACSAPKPLVFDFDRGIDRMEYSYIPQYSQCDSYSEFLNDLETADYKACETVIIDTGGSLVQFMQDWAKRQESKASRNMQAMYGVIKRETNRLLWQIKEADKKNLIVIFHTTEQTKGDNIITRLSCEGSTKDNVWTLIDFGGHMFTKGGKTFIGFTPTDEYYAKGTHGIKGEYEVPRLKPDGSTPNVFLTNLFESANKHIVNEVETGNKYFEIVEAGKSLIDTVVDADTANSVIEKFKTMEHVKTSRVELAALMKAKLDELNLVMDNGKYRKADGKEKE